MTRSALYLGHVTHARRDEHVRRAFRYPVYVAAIDLDELPALHRSLRLFSHNGRNLFGLHDGDYARSTGVRDPAPRGPARSLADEHRAVLAAHGIAAPARVRLVTNLRVLGYTFNPVSFFLGYDTAGALASVVAEVNNTYGGRHRYVLGPQQRLAGVSTRIGFRVPRVFFVSPFLHGDVDYELWFDAPLDGTRLAITMHVHTRSGVTRPEVACTEDTRTEVTRTEVACTEDTRPEVACTEDARTEVARTEDTRTEVTRNEVARTEVTRIFTAHLTGSRRTLSDRALAAAAIRYPWMTLQVIALIHYEALALHARRVPFRRPGADHRPLPAIGSRPRGPTASPR